MVGHIGGLRERTSGAAFYAARDATLMPITKIKPNNLESNC